MSIKADDIDAIDLEMIVDNRAYPSPHGYGGFPKSLCTLVNK